MSTHESIERVRHDVLRTIGRSGAAASGAAAASRAASSPSGVAGDLLPRDIAPLIDHTLLKPDAALRAIEALCREAVEYAFASVCVNPCWVSTCPPLVRGSAVRVCTVVAFPLGASVPAVKVAEAGRAIADGAREIDMVMNIGALKSQQLSLVADDIEAVAHI